MRDWLTVPFCAIRQSYLDPPSEMLFFRHGSPNKAYLSFDTPTWTLHLAGSYPGQTLLAAGHGRGQSTEGFKKQPQKLEGRKLEQQWPYTALPQDTQAIKNRQTGICNAMKQTFTTILRGMLRPRSTNVLDRLRKDGTSQCRRH
eukprot:1149995-Pelagomonas_calceolata.AAC.2